MIAILLSLLLLSTCLPPMQGLTDDVLMPKWYGVVMMAMVLLAVHRFTRDTSAAMEKPAALLPPIRRVRPPMMNSIPPL